MNKLFGILGWIIASAATTMLILIWTGLDLTAPSDDRTENKLLTQTLASIEAEAETGTDQLSEESSEAIRSALMFARSLMARPHPQGESLEPLKAILLLIERLKTGDSRSVKEAVSIFGKIGASVSPTDLVRLQESVESAINSKQKEELLEKEQVINEIINATRNAIAEEPLDIEAFKDLQKKITNLRKPGTDSYQLSTELAKKLTACQTTVEAIIFFLNNIEQGNTANAIANLERKFQFHSSSTDLVLLPKARIEEIVANHYPIKEKLDEAEKYSRWIKDVDVLFQEIFGLSQAESVATRKVQELLLKASALEVKLPKSNNNAVNVARNKLKAATNALYTWSRYSTLMEQGYREEAIDVVKRLAPDSRTEYPLISAKDLERLTSQPLNPDEQTDSVGDINEILKSVDSFEKKTISESVGKIKSLRFAANETRPKHDAIKYLNQLDWAIDRRDSGSATSQILRTIQKSISLSSDDLEERLEELYQQFTLEALSDHFTKRGRPKPAENDNALKYAFQNIEAYETDTSLSVSEFHEDLMIYQAVLNIFDTDEPDWLDDNLKIVRSFLAGERYEKSGDLLLALRNYRNVLNYPASKISLHQRIPEKIESIRETAPYLLDSDNEIIMKRLNSISSQLNRLTSTINQNLGRPR